MFDLQSRKEFEEKGEWSVPTKHSEEGHYKFSMDFLREAENHCVLQSPIPITCPVRLIHGLKDEDVPWHISMQVAERVLSPDVDVILRRHGQHRMSEKDDIKLMVYTIDDLIDKLTTLVWVRQGGVNLRGCWDKERKDCLLGSQPSRNLPNNGMLLCQIWPFIHLLFSLYAICHFNMPLHCKLHWKGSFPASCSLISSGCICMCSRLYGVLCWPSLGLPLLLSLPLFLFFDCFDPSLVS